MTPREFTDGLPLLTNNPLPSQPPFYFRGLSSRIFPLRASLHSLQELCDGYLNIIPPEAGYFRAAAPYAYLMVLDYSQMGEAFMQSGWFAQTEVFFGVTVEWYKRVNGQWRFHDWAVITPYIFVNDDFSMPLGRTVYGFQKILARVMRTEDQWMKDPLAPMTVSSIETQVFPEAYSGTGPEWRTLLEVDRAQLANLQAPFDPRSPMMPWMLASNLAGAAGGLGRDAMWMLQSMRISPVNPLSDPSFLPAMLTKMMPWFGPAGQGFIQNSINLKQFRNSENPAQVCFQALTNGCMRTTGFNGGGLLGEEYLMLGDLAGGYSIKVHEYSSLPIVRTMGLEVHKQWRDGDTMVNELKPVMPMWLNVDITYFGGENLAWRTVDGIWKDAAGAPFHSSQRPAKGQEPLFNNSVASAIEAVSGPFEFADTTVRVLPLLAERATLQAFLDSYLNQPLASPIVKEGEQGREEIRFEVWSRPKQAINPGDPIGGHVAYVYLTATSFGSVTSGTDNVGNWANYELSFMIPVKMKRKNAAGEWETSGVGLVPAYTFVDNCIAAFSRMEIQGINTATATFLRPESQWLSAEGELADPEQTLLRVEAETYAAYNAADKATVEPIVEITQGAPGAGLGGAPEAPWQWAEALRKELSSKNASKMEHRVEMKAARALTLELLGNGDRTPFSIYTLKQFRDVADPNKACYQSLVRVNRALKEVCDLREIEDTLVVRIHDYPSLAIAVDLGIVSQRLPDSPAGVTYTMQAVRPFYIRGTLYEPLSSRLLARSGVPDWTLCKPPANGGGEQSKGYTAFQTLLSDEPGSPEITVDWRAETLVDQVDPTLTAAIVSEARQRRLNWNEWDRGAEKERQIKRNGAERAATLGVKITAAQARAAMDAIDPQMAIESVLSREWANFDPNARWRSGRKDLLGAINALAQRGDLKAYVEAELYRRMNNATTARPGAVAGVLMPVDEPLEENSTREPLRPGVQSSAAQDHETKALQKEEAAAAKRWKKVQGAHPDTEAHQRWSKEMLEILKSNRQFTQSRLDMERCVDVLAPIEVLGFALTEEALRRLGNKEMTANQAIEAAIDLIDKLIRIHELDIVGEPSERNNLDNRVQADQLRLGDVIALLSREVVTTGSAQTDLELGRRYQKEFNEAVELARNYCDAQQEALLNKLSRAYQKPDFCVRRDALGKHSDELLPLPFSWDEEWYYGEAVNLD